MGDRLADARGALSAEVAVVTPLIVLTLMLVIQFALWQHAQHVATVSAQRALAAAQVERGRSDDGTAAAWETLRRMGDGLLRSPDVEVRRSTDTVSVAVRGQVVSLVPGIERTVVARATGPIERFRSRESG